MKILLIINYQREIPPFLLTQISIAKNHFDKIIYLTPLLKNDNSKMIASKKVIVKQIKARDRILSFLKLPILFLRREVLKECFNAINKKKMSINYLKHLALEIVPADILYMSAKKEFELVEKNNDVYVMSAWFNASAYTVARLKKSYSSITAVSWAHAFEIDPERNLYVDLSLNKFKHMYLDKTSFISENMKRKYMQVMSSDISVSKVDVQYLGSIKKEKQLNSKTEKKYHICSCAGVTSIKRIHLLAEALENWEKGDIMWTHLGGGPLLEEIQRKVSFIENKNKNVKIQLIGKVTNNEVQQYYQSTGVDLFVNTSRLEGLPISIMEAMSYGIPAVATDVGGTREIVDETTGFLLNENPDPETIRIVLESYKVMTEENRGNYRKSALKKWETFFDAENNLNKYFEEVLHLKER